MGMRVLVTTPAGLGHVHPMVPLARALAAGGHQVLWAVPADGVVHVERAGIPAVPTGAPGLTRPADVIRRYPELQGLAPAEVPDVLFGKMFGAVGAPAILADLAPVAREWRPDLVLADAAEFAGHIVAAELGVPSVTKGFGPLLPEPRVAAAGDEVAPLWKSRGLEPRPYGGCYDHLYIDIYPPELDGGAAPHVARRQLLRPVTDDGYPPTSSPPPFPDLPSGPSGVPRVYATMGTVFNDPDAVRVLLAALGELDVAVLVTVGHQIDPGGFGSPPPNVRIERYVSQAAVLPHCAVVVSHAGSGTVLATISHGLPQLCLPQGADQFLNANAIASAGAGISLPPGQATADAVGGAVVRLLEDVSFTGAAGRVRRSIESMPAPEDIVAVLEAST
ncbi:MAG: glycosyltransferase [Actinomycetota bacterium]|nr:glycosyltransferase [Actinomycetota bacterium]